MATAEQIKSLIRSYGKEDKERFFAVALQVAAHEARQGHTNLALEIRQLVEKERRLGKKHLKVIPFPRDLKGLILSSQPSTPRSSLVIDQDGELHINKIIHEYRQRAKLKSHGLSHRRKILLVGPPGTGKTMTAKVLANELKLTLHTIQVDRLVTKFMGETSAKLRQIFDMISEEHGVYLFDEFDAIGGERARENDVGEMRRVLNSFLQFIEQDESDSLVIAATNHPNLLDRALFRRFDDVIHYHTPSEDERKSLISNILASFKGKRLSWDKILKQSEGLSHADLDTACRDAIKESILKDDKKISTTQLLSALNRRQKAYLRS